MMEFQTLCYLDNPKTGCTYVAEFLRMNCAERLLRFRKHRVPAAVREKLYFINVREPLDLYRSLFSYGLDGEGGVYKRLARAGHADLYEGGPSGFPGWMDFVLDEANAPLIAFDYSPAAARRVGLVSYRFLRLAAPVFAWEPSRFEGDILATYEAESVVDHVIRFESLNSDLGDLVTGPLEQSMRDVDAALAWIRESPKINQSKRASRAPLPELPPETLERLRDKESVVYGMFYPGGPA